MCAKSMIDGPSFLNLPNKKARRSPNMNCFIMASVSQNLSSESIYNTQGSFIGDLGNMVVP